MKKYLVLLLIFTSCKYSSTTPVEHVYKSYSFKQLKGFLNNRWQNTKQQQERKDNLRFSEFIFSSDAAGTFQEYEEKGGVTTFATCQPFFHIYKTGNQFAIEFVAMMEKQPDSLIIKTVSDQRLILSNGKRIEIYRRLVEKN